jgi:hypothetical protein
MTLPHLIAVILGPPGIYRLVRVVVLAFALSAVSRLIPVRAGVQRIRRERRRQLARQWRDLD